MGRLNLREAAMSKCDDYRDEAVKTLSEFYDPFIAG